MSMAQSRPWALRVLLVSVMTVTGLLATAAPGTAGNGTAGTGGTAATVNANLRLAYVEATHGQTQRQGAPEGPAGTFGGAAARAPAPAPAAGVTADSTTCWYFDDYRYGKNIFGGTLFTFHTRTNWCGDGSWVRLYAYTTADASTVVGWAYYGLTQNYDQYGVDWNQFRSVRQGQFCIINCIGQNVYLTNDVLVGPAGQVYRS